MVLAVLILAGCIAYAIALRAAILRNTRHPAK